MLHLLVRGLQLTALTSSLFCLLSLLLCCSASVCEFCGQRSSSPCCYALWTEEVCIHIFKHLALSMLKFARRSFSRLKNSSLKLQHLLMQSLTRYLDASWSSQISLPSVSCGSGLHADQRYWSKVENGTTLDDTESRITGSTDEAKSEGSSQTDGYAFPSDQCVFCAGDVSLCTSHP